LQSIPAQCSASLCKVDKIDSRSPLSEEDWGFFISLLWPPRVLSYMEKVNNDKQRKCARCKNIFPLDLFPINRGLKHGHGYYCKNCKNIVKRENRHRYRDREKTKIQTIKYKYGLSEQEYINLLERSGHQCAICKRSDKRLVIDHNHQTKQVRGLLCATCNTGLGHFYEDEVILTGAINYVKTHKILRINQNRT